MRPCLTAVVLAAVPWLAGGVPCQSEWVPVQSPPPPARDPLAWRDPRTARIAIWVRGIDIDYAHSMLEWNGGRWIPLDPPLVPPGRYAAGAAFDAARGRAVLFGGWDRNALLVADTREWDGQVWTQPSATPQPSPRAFHAMTFDAARGRVLMFGGRGSAGLLDETWLWDGARWTRAAPGSSPGPRLGAALAWDDARQRAVLFGGLAGSGALGDTWLWDGSAWTRTSPAHSPPPSAHAAMTFDSRRGRVLLTGGFGPGVPVGHDVWEWNGNDWLPRSAASQPPPRYRHAFVYDAARDRAVLFGGTPTPTDHEGLDDTWLWDPTTGTWSRALPPSPEPRYRPALVTDTLRGRVTMMGGRGVAPRYTIAGTWSWDGRQWNRLPTTTEPTPSTYIQTAYDSRRDEIVRYTPHAPAQTWLFDGTDWRDAAPAHAPTSRLFTAMTFDSARGEVVMFGGEDTSGSSVLTDQTWTWDGTDWTLRQPAHAPSPRHVASLAFDPVRGEVVLYGGWDVSGALGDTWVWDGTDWTRRQPAHSPGPQSAHDLVFDPDRGRVLLLAGALLATASAWEWDGADWTRVPLTAPAVSTTEGAMAFDPVRRGVLFLGGLNAFGWVQPGTWFLTATAATAAAFGNGCAGSAGVPLLRGSGSPGIGAAFGFELLDGPPQAPAVLGLSLASRAVPLGPCTFYHDPATSLLDLVLATDRHGFAWVAAPVPLDRALLGAVLHGQAGALDPGAPLGFVLTAGLRVRLGD
ncbi:MAG: hypothetical protein IPM29_26260 [Planctomycetes bacterium]|nr:hypothetical protein [Planctomycetota bacterium]